MLSAAQRDMQTQHRNLGHLTRLLLFLKISKYGCKLGKQYRNIGQIHTRKIFYYTVDAE
jgi:hypothetical protein